MGVLLKSVNIDDSDKKIILDYSILCKLIFRILTSFAIISYYDFEIILNLSIKTG